MVGIIGIAATCMTGGAAAPEAVEADTAFTQAAVGKLGMGAFTTGTAAALDGGKSSNGWLVGAGLGVAVVGANHFPVPDDVRKARIATHFALPPGKQNQCGANEPSVMGKVVHWDAASCAGLVSVFDSNHEYHDVMVEAQCVVDSSILTIGDLVALQVVTDRRTASASGCACLPCLQSTSVSEMYYATSVRKLQVMTRGAFATHGSSMTSNCWQQIFVDDPNGPNAMPTLEELLNHASIQSHFCDKTHIVLSNSMGQQFRLVPVISSSGHLAWHAKAEQ